METVSFPIVHSTPENFIQEAKSCGDFRKSLQPCLVGAYTSMNSVKQKHLELETKLFSTEKLCSIAALNEKYKWNNAPFERAEKALSMLAFHDILSGTCGPDGEKSSLRKADCAIELLNDEFNKAFFAICTEHVKAGEGEFPIFMYNALPYKRVTECEVEYLMPDAIAPTEEEYFVTVKHGGNVIASQCVHELTNINYDRRKRIVFIAELAPVDVTRFDITVEKRKKVFLKGDLLEDIVVEDKFKRVVIGRKTGLLESFVVNGKEMISGDAFCPVMYDDNADPWGWYMDAVGKNPESFHLSSCKEGVFRDMEPVRIIEEGDIYTEVECLFELGRSSVRVSYKIYKNLPEMDVNVDVIWSDRLKALKIKVPTTLDGAFIGQIPFGTDTFPKDGTEITAHRFIAMEDGKHALTLYNDCTYGFSCDEKVMYATLLRGVAYCAHPLGDLPLIHDDRYIQSVEEGRHHFGFRLSYDKVSQLENRAQEFVNKPYGLNFFPHGQKVQGDIITKHLVIENQDISLVAFYQDGDEYVLRLINNSEEAKKCEIALCGSKFEFNFEKYEVKTFKYDGSVLEEATCMV